MKKTRFLWIFFAAALIVLTACGPAPTPPPSPLPTQVQTETVTPLPSATPSPSSTLTPTATNPLSPTAIQTATVTATPRPTFAGFQVAFVDYGPSGMQFGFVVPGIRQNYRLDVSGKPFTCSLNDKYPDKLFCTGQTIAPKTQVKLTFLPLDGDLTPVFMSSYQVPALVTPTVDMATAKGFNAQNCPVRGVNLRCETEYRVDGGGCCVVSTCMDACGYYFSVDTCPQGMTFQGICQGTPPPLLPPNP